MDPDLYFKEVCEIRILDASKWVILSHGFKIRDLEVKKEETFEEEIFKSTIGYKTRLEKNVSTPLSMTGVVDENMYVEHAKYLDIIDQCVLRVIVFRAKKLPDLDHLILSCKCNGTVQTFEPAISQISHGWNHVFYL